MEAVILDEPIGQPPYGQPMSIEQWQQMDEDQPGELLATTRRTAPSDVATAEPSASAVVGATAESPTAAPDVSAVVLVTSSASASASAAPTSPKRRTLLPEGRRE